MFDQRVADYIHLLETNQAVEEDIQAIKVLLNENIAYVREVQRLYNLLVWATTPRLVFSSEDTGEGG